MTFSTNSAIFIATCIRCFYKPDVLDIYKYNRRKPSGLFDTLDKRIFRKDILALRLKMPGDDVLNSSKAIFNTLISLDVFKNSFVVALYAPFKNEADLMPLLDIKGKQFVFPKVKKGTRKLEFYEVTSLKDLTAGSYGILEPVEELVSVNIDKIEFFAVPGVAFSQKCERIGYGGGYYDSTLLHRSLNSTVAGIAYDLQIVESGFSTDGDQPVDMVITETRIFKNITTS